MTHLDLAVRSLCNAAVRQFAFIFAALLVSPVLCGGPVEAKEPARSVGIVTFTFDDASKHQFEQGLSIARSYGIVGTIFVPTGLIGEAPSTKDNWYMSWDSLREFNDAGWEIGVHGLSHTKLTDLGPDDLATELDRPIADINERIGKKPVSFSSPYGAFNDGTIEEIARRYRYHLSWKGHLGRNPKTGIDRRYIGRLEVTKGMGAAVVCGEMVNAAQSNSWLILLFHGIVANKPGDSEVSAKMFEKIISCADYLQERGIIKVMTVGETMQELQPQN